MRLLRTQDDFRALESMPASEIGWNEALAIMQDVLLDIKNESQIELNEMEFNSDALQKWRKLAKMMNTIPMGDEVSALTERSRQRLAEIQNRLEENIEATENVQREMQAVFDEESRLRNELEAQETMLRELRERKRENANLTAQIEKQKDEIKALQNIDVEELRNISASLAKEKAAKQTLAKEYGELSGQITILTNECETLQSKIDSQKIKISEVVDKKLEAEQTLVKKEAESGRLAREYSELTKAIGDTENQVCQRQSENETLRKQLVDRKVELESQKNECAKVKESFDSISAQVQYAITERDNLQNEIDQNNKELDEIARNISSLKLASPDSKKKLEKERTKLEEERKKKNAEIQELSQKVEELNAQVSAAAKENDELLSQQNELMRQFDEKQKLIEQAKDEIRSMDVSLKTIEQERFKIESEIRELKNKKRAYIDDIEKFKKFLKSDECEAIHREIFHYQTIAEEYQEAVRRLFPSKFTNNAAVFVEQLVSLEVDYAQMQKQLYQELETMKRLFEHLSASYIEVVHLVEERMRKSCSANVV